MGAKSKIETYIKNWERKCYKNGIPDEAPAELDELVPCYKKICKAIMKNENNLESLGYSRKKCEVYNRIKKMELIERGIIKKDNQLKLFI